MRGLSAPAQRCLITGVEGGHVDRDPFSPDRYLGRGQRRIKAALVRAGLPPRSPRPCRVDYVPGRSLSITWSADLSVGEASSVGPIVLHATHRPLPRLERVAEDEWDNPVYLFPALKDPLLPGLASVLDLPRLTELLVDAGVMCHGEHLVASITRLEPLRRATIVASHGSRVTTVEIVPVRSVDGLIARHLLLTDQVPAPRFVARTHDGVVMLSEVPGATLDRTLLRGDRVPTIREVDAILDRLPRPLVHEPGAIGVLERVGVSVELLAAVCPEMARRLGVLSERLAPFAAVDPGQLVPHHGDLRPANLVVRSDRVDGLLEVGGVGEGYRIDDLAELLGRVVVLAHVARSTSCDQVCESWLQEIDRSRAHSPAALRARVGAAILHSATDCFRHQEVDWARGVSQRIDLAESWLDRATQAAHPTGGLAVASP